MDKYISCFPQALSSSKCNELINFFNDRSTKKKNGPNNEYCKSKEIYYYEYVSLNSFSPLFINELKLHLTQYANIHPFLKSSGCPNWGIYNRCNLQKYLPKKYYSGEHCEHSNTKTYSNRILAWMFYLNNIKYGGGGTYFPQQDLTIEAKRGDLYVWPAGWTHSHRGVPARSEEKFIITGWCSYQASK